MQKNNMLFNISENDNSRTCYHGYQNFGYDENVTPEKAHEIGVELVKKLYPSFQVIVSTHVDKGHTHNHFVLNSVNLEGRKLEDRLANPIEGLYGLRDASDLISVQHGIKILNDSPKIGRYHKNRYIYSVANDSWKSKIISKLEELKESCLSFDDLLEGLATSGYSIKPGKNIRIKPYGKTRHVTMKILGDEYSEEALKQFFKDKRKNQQTFSFANYSISVEGSEVLRMQSRRAEFSKQSVLLSMKSLTTEGDYPKYYNSRYLEVRRYHQLVDSLNFLNQNNIYSFSDLENSIIDIENEIEEKTLLYQEQLSKNETMQLRLPLAELYLKYLDHYQTYMEQLPFVKGKVEESDEVKAFKEVMEELNVSTTDEVKEIIMAASKINEETNRQYAYLSYLKNRASQLSKITGESLEKYEGYIKSISFSKNMIDSERSNDNEFCIRLPYTDLYIYLPKECISWYKYEESGVVYLIDDKEYMLYDKDNNEIEKVLGEEVDIISKDGKDEVRKYYTEEKEIDNYNNN